MQIFKIYCQWMLSEIYLEFETHNYLS